MQTDELKPGRRGATAGVSHAALEGAIRGAIERGDHTAAAERAIRGYGAEIFGFLLAFHRDREDAAEVFGCFSERLVRDLPAFRGDSSLRTWAYALARHASLNYRRDARRRRERLAPLPEGSALSALAAPSYSETEPYLRAERRSRVAALRASLPRDDQELLILRVDRRLAWGDVVRVLHAGGGPLADDDLRREAARLRQRFQALKARLLELGRGAGLIDELEGGGASAMVASGWQTQDDVSDIDDSSSAGAFLHELASASPVAPPAIGRDRVGERLGHFELLGRLGHGGMGEVYLAFDRRLRRNVAIKILRPEALGDPKWRRRLWREAMVAAAVSHPNIVAVFDFGEAECGEPYLAMECVEGRTLRACLGARRAPLPEGEALRIAHAVAQGLAAAHRAGVVHRDVKPENVMLTGDGQVKIVDFGLAKPLGAAPFGVAAASPAISFAGHAVGTAHYMAPEQLSGGAVDVRADLFSFGVMLFEMLAGSRPFDGATGAEVGVAILRDEPPQLRGVSAVLAAVVARCLAKEPARRYADAGALLVALDAAANCPGAPPGGPPPARGFRLFAASLAALEAVLGSLSGLRRVLWFGGRPAEALRHLERAAERCGHFR